MASKEYVRILLPVNTRLVGGDPYEAKPATNDDGSPKLIKKGDNAGKPVTYCYTPIAIPKSADDWKDEPWGQQIVAFAKKVWPGSQPERKDFAWKVTDGDSTELNKNDKRACDRDGYKGHWVLQLQGMQAPALLNADGSKGLALVQDEPMKAGDHVQAYIKVTSNESNQTAGLYMEATHIAFQRTGVAIISEAIDASKIGFGGSAPAPTQAPAGNPPPPPRTEFSGQAAPPPPPVASRLTQKALDAGAKTEADLLAWEGWTEGLLIEHGYLTA